MIKNFPDELSEKRILIVDDVSFYRDFIKQFLKNSGHVGDVVEAFNLSDSIKKINEIYTARKKIDLIIVDLHLPDGKGTTLIEKIRKTKSLADVPILLLTTDDKTTAVLEALQFGVDDYCFKPIKQDEMLTKIVKIWTRKKAIL